jgi:hypothetical protein
MSSQYKENNFSTESLSSPIIVDQNKENIPKKTNIDHLMKKIIVERHRERKGVAITLGTVFFSIILIFYFYQN